MTSDDYLICEGCGGKIFAGDSVIEMELCDCGEPYLIHESLDCLLKLDGVSGGVVQKIETVSPSKLRRVK